MSYTVTFDEAALNVTSDDFSLTATGTAAGTIQSVTGSGASYTVTVSSISGDGTLRLDLDAGTDIADGVGNTPPAAFTSGQVHTVDTVAPAVPTVDLAAASDSGVSDSDDITNVTSPVIEGITEAGATVELTSSVDGVLGTATANGSGVWTLTPTLSAAVHDLTATATDGAGNISAASSALSVTVDTTGPASTFSSVPTGTQTGAFTGMSAAFSETVYGFTLGSVTTSANVSLSNLTASAINDNFGFEVTPTATGTFTATFDLAAGVVTDAAGNANTAAGQASVAFNVTAPDTTPPAVQSIVLSGSPAANATSVSYTVTFDEAAFNVTSDDFSLTATGTAAGTISAVTGSGASYTVTVSSISGDGTLRLDLDAGTDIADGVGNTPPAAFTSGQVHTVDTVPPAVPTVDLAAAFDTGISNSDDITNNASPFLTGVTDPNAFVSVTSSIDGNLGVATASASGVWALVPSSPLTDGVHAMTAFASDGVGNNSATSSALSVTIDTAAPSTSFASVPTGTQTGAFTGMSVDFSETVFGFALNAVTTSPNVTLSNLVAAATNDSFSFDVAPTAAGSFTASFDVAAGVVTDAAGNANTAAAQESVAFNVAAPDTTPPAVANVTVLGAPAPNAASVDFQMTFNEPVFNVTADDFVVFSTNNSYVAGAPLTVTGSGTTYVITVTIAGGSGLMRVNIDTQSDIVDASGNGNGTNGFAAVATFPISQAHTFDLDAPAAPVVGLLAATDTGVSNIDDITNDNTPIIAGIAEGGSTVEVTSSIAGVLGTATASGTGRWELQVPVVLADGVHVMTGTARDAAGNVSPVSLGLPVTIDTAAPSATFASVPAGTQTGAFSGMSADFSEEVFGFTLTSVTTSANVALSNLVAAATNDSFGFDVTPTASGIFTATFDLAAGVVTDAAGNANTAAAQESVSFSTDTIPPSVALSGPAGPVNGLFQVSAVFSEPVNGVTLADFSVANGAAAGFTAVSATDYTVDVTPAGDGPVTVDMAAGAASDAAGNLSLAAPQFSVTADVTPPSVALSTTAATAVSGPFQVDIVFSETVTGFVLNDVQVANGSVTALSTNDSITFVAEITPTSAGSVDVSVPAGVAADLVGNVNLASQVLTQSVDLTPPALTISLPANDVTGPFTADFTFSEPVNDFTLADIAVTNGAASALTGSGASYSATITPATLGDVTVAVAAGAARDAAGNLSLADTQDVSAVSTANSVTLTVASTVVNPETVLGTATVTNPGSDSLTFNASADVPWLTVDPASGSIPGLSSLALTIRANSAVDALDPGTYQGVVTVAFGSGSGSASSAATTAAVSTGTSLAIPVTILIEERFGSATLVVRTPGGPVGEATFTYTSDIAAFDGISLTTSGGQASANADDLLFGVYALSQATPAGWVLESISCTGDVDGGSVINVATGSLTLDLDPGEAITCTFENRRDEAQVVLATQQTIRNFMIRRADRLIEAAPELSLRFEDRRTTSRGQMSANADGSGRYQMEFASSLAGLRNASLASAAAAPGRNPERPFAENWDIWVAAEIGGVRDSRAGAEAESDFGVVQLGVDYSVSPDLLIGLLGQYDWADEDSGEIHIEAGGVATARIEGEGWMAGPYAVWRLHDGLILDGVALYGRSDNQVNPLGLYEDSFSTDRFMLGATLTGELSSGPWRLRPQIGWTHFEETQDGYQDALGFDIPSQTIAIGRLRAGPELVWRNTGDHGSYIELSSSLRAVWDYQSADLLTASGLLAGADTLRADSRFGLTSRLSNGALIRLESAFSGLGLGEFEANSLRLEVRVPFGASGPASGGRLAGSVSGLCGNPAGLGYENAAGLAHEEDACALRSGGGAH
ncbi:MAG: Ig-like domain-containing protein [Alphaproteobacteria bacterium]|nr:Ig-like domain-containing protein [Alphaproteobacteria bacterium]